MNSEPLYFSDFLSKEQINAFLLSGKFKIKNYRKDVVIHNAGDTCSYVEIILSGNVVALQVDKFGNYLSINKFTANHIIGGNIIFADHPRYPLTFMSHTKVSILMIHKDFLFDLLIDNPNLLRHYLNLVCNLTCSFGVNLKLYTKMTIREHILEFLNSQCIIQNSRNIILTESKKELADRFGVQRTSISREFTRMEKDGLIIINRNNNSIELLK